MTGSVFSSLVDDILVVLVKEWLQWRDITLLDSSVSNTFDRENLFCIFQNKKHSVGQTFSQISPRILHWLYAREWRVNYFHFTVMSVNKGANAVTSISDSGKAGSFFMSNLREIYVCIDDQSAIIGCMRKISELCVVNGLELFYFAMPNHSHKTVQFDQHPQLESYLQTILLHNSNMKELSVMNYYPHNNNKIASYNILLNHLRNLKCLMELSFDCLACIDDSVLEMAEQLVSRANSVSGNFPSGHILLCWILLLCDVIKHCSKDGFCCCVTDCNERLLLLLVKHDFNFNNKFNSKHVRLILLVLATIQYFPCESNLNNCLL